MTVRKKIRVLLFGDNLGIPQLLRHIRSANIVGIVAAAIRPQYFEELEHLAQQLRVPFLVQPKWQSASYGNFKAQVAGLCADLIWVNSYSMIIRDDVLSLARLGGLNIHAALLPRNRGCSPIQWAILKGEYETGVTLHEIDSGLDTGPVIDQRVVSLLLEDTWLDVRDRLTTATEELIIHNMSRILSGKWKAVSQVEALATVGRRRTPEDGAFSWDASVVTIYNKIRALLPPLPPAYYYDNKGRKHEMLEYQTIWQVAAQKYDILGGWFQSEFVRLRPLCKSDVTLLCELITHRELVILSASFHQGFGNDHKSWADSMMTKRSDLVLFAIEELKSGAVIGTCQLFNVNWRHRSAELQLFIGDFTSHGKGYGSQVIQLLAKFGFSELDLHRIYLHVFATNDRAIRIFEKCGFNREGLLKDSAYIDGHWVDVVVMGMLANHG